MRLKNTWLSQFSSTADRTTWICRWLKKKNTLGPWSNVFELVATTFISKLFFAENCQNFVKVKEGPVRFCVLRDKWKGLSWSATITIQVLYTRSSLDSSLICAGLDCCCCCCCWGCGWAGLLVVPCNGLAWNQMSTSKMKFWIKTSL